jgi:hypothetical protein
MHCLRPTFGGNMILAFTRNSTVSVFEDIHQAFTYCEAIDVEEGEYTFLDEKGFVLKVIQAPPEKRRLLFFSVSYSPPFALVNSQEKRSDLLKALESGDIRFGRGPTTIQSLHDLRIAAPLLFLSPGNPQPSASFHSPSTRE